MAKVFISHSWKDNNISKKIAHDLIRDGAEVWIDYARIKPGEGLPDRISQALEWCDTLVLVWSEAAAESYYVKLEWQCAVDMQKKIIPCLIDDSSRPAILRGFLYIGFKDFDEGYSHLCSALELRKEEESHRSKFKKEGEEISATDEKLVNVIKSTATWEAPEAETKVEKSDIGIRQDYSGEHKAGRHWLKDNRFLLLTISGMAIVVLFVFVFVMPPIREQWAWKNALQKNAVVSYQNYLDSYPRGKYQVDATRRHEELVLVAREDSLWDKSKKENTVQSYRIYLKDYAQGRYTDQAKLKIKDILGIDWIFIPGGTFQMGDTFGDVDIGYGETVHTVTVSDFYLSKAEVSVAQFKAFCKANSCEMPPAPVWGWQDNHPMVNISWNDAVAFCQWAGGRLPTEAEWEYAAREGGKKIRFGNGKNIADPKEINFNASADYMQSYSVIGVYPKQTTPVGSFTPNALGLYDMSGNVWEWCADRYASNYYQNSPTKNPQGPSSGESRVFRGGSWGYFPWDIRCSCRGWNHTMNWNDNLGFRIASSIAP